MNDATPNDSIHHGENRTTELERTLSLPAALTIGVGTMVGAGIFIFPGLAAGEAGPAATLSFAIGAALALVVALQASELATALPRSGGAYHFVSRGLGRFLGAMTGISQWLGLVFAAAFYVSGFGSYLLNLLQEAGLSPGWGGAALAFVAAVGLTGINITGTENMGRLQNGVVLILLVILGFFLAVGLLSVFGAIGPRTVPETLAPYGTLPIFTTAALVFTSYLGFVQIANVGGEIRRPARNLPLAMVGSVAIVGLLYVLTLFVSTGVISSERLAELGQTAIVAVARQLMGRVGGLIILGAGLLATLSSANASILSSSRSVFALGQDGVVPQALSRISHRFATPHFSLLATGVPISVLAWLGPIDLLAEVASFLHLIIYGLLCVAVVMLRRRRPGWYRPTFRAPGYPILPLIGAVGSFSMIPFMQPRSIGLGVGVLAASGAWYWFFGREEAAGSGDDG